jgi:hypothetical protein
MDKYSESNTVSESALKRCVSIGKILALEEGFKILPGFQIESIIILLLYK